MPEVRLKEIRAYAPFTKDDALMFEAGDPLPDHTRAISRAKGDDVHTLPRQPLGVRGTSRRADGA